MMDWVDLTWPMLAAASLVLGLIHAMVWLGQPRQRIHLALAIAAYVGSSLLLFYKPTDKVAGAESAASKDETPKADNDA